MRSFVFAGRLLAAICADLLRGRDRRDVLARQALRGHPMTWVQVAGVVALAWAGLLLLVSFAVRDWPNRWL